MSYDLYLFNIPDGEDPLRFSRQRTREEAETVNPGPINPEAEARKRSIVGALQQCDSALEPFEFSFQEIAEIEGITVDEARIRYRHIELNGPDDGPGIQITLFDQDATLTVPYWHAGSQAQRVWRQIRHYLKVLEESGRYSVFDPQLDTMVDLSEGDEEVHSMYAKGVEKVNKIASDQASANAKPWWKFW